MSVLRNLEAKLGGIVEGAFGRAFKTSVQPVELAHKLAKEMEENQMVSVSRVYVPNHYRVFLSPRDREQFSSYEPALRKELSDYLLEHARQERLALTSRPQVEFHTDDRLELGEFGIQAQLLGGPEEDARARRGRRPRPATSATRWSTRPTARRGRSSRRSIAGQALLVAEGAPQRAERRARAGRAQPRVRRRGVRPERVAPPHRAAPRRARLGRRRPRVDQRHEGQRAPRRATPSWSPATGSRSASPT